jgi:hypothetical protein
LADRGHAPTCLRTLCITSAPIQFQVPQADVQVDLLI